MEETRVVLCKCQRNPRWISQFDGLPASDRRNIGWQPVIEVALTETLDEPSLRLRIAQSGRYFARRVEGPH